MVSDWDDFVLRMVWQPAKFSVRRKKITVRMMKPAEKEKSLVACGWGGRQISIKRDAIEYADVYEMEGPCGVLERYYLLRAWFH